MKNLKYILENKFLIKKNIDNISYNDPILQFLYDCFKTYGKYNYDGIKKFENFKESWFKENKTNKEYEMDLLSDRNIFGIITEKLNKFSKSHSVNDYKIENSTKRFKIEDLNDDYKWVFIYPRESKLFLSIKLYKELFS